MSYHSPAYNQGSAYTNATTEDLQAAQDAFDRNTRMVKLATVFAALFAAGAAALTAIL